MQMNLVTLTQVSKQYSERKLLNEVDLLINKGDRIGLIGVNGSGKTTLLRIIAGQEAPDAGTVTVWGGVSVQFLPQQPQLNEELTILEQVFDSDAPQVQLLKQYEMVSLALSQRPSDSQLQTQLAQLSEEMTRQDGWAAEATVKSILTQLGINEFEAKISTLSGGQRKRVALARALITPADLLIMDEPTNHIDAETVAWLEDYCQTMPNSLLMVTHDRYFLDRVANRIIELDHQTLIPYFGNYSNYLETRANREQKLAEAEEKRKKLIKTEQEWANRTPMARGGKQKARLNRLEALQNISHSNKAMERGIYTQLAARRLGKQVLEAENLSKSYGDRQLFSGVNFELGNGDRIGLVGPNGAGKSTLLNILAGITEPDSGTVNWGETVHLGYYDQQSRGLQTAIDKGMTVHDFLADQAALIETSDGRRIDPIVMLDWFMFSYPQQQAQVSALSGGERRRLYLLSVLAQKPNVLLLDEPTNDLDIQTLTILEEFLDTFSGSVIVVSHDRYFMDRTVDFLAVFDNGRFSPRYPAPYASFIERHKQNLAQEAKASTPSKPKTEPTRQTDNNRPRRLSYNEKRELEQLNETVEQLETEQAELQTAINEIGNDYQRLGELTERLQTVEAELDELMERWLELSEIAEG